MFRNCTYISFMSEQQASRPVAVVTGASAGIGAATARRLVAAGYAVVVAARRGERLERLAGEIRESGGEALAVPGDLADAAFCRRLIAEAAAWGELEVLVANAGMGYSGAFTDMADEEIRRLVDVNLLGVVRTVHAALPIMRARGGGRIVMVGSVLSRITTPGAAVYCATKHALVGFADSLRYEVRRDHIRIISILPGYTSTEFFDAMISRGKRGVDKVKRFWFFHSPDDVAEVIARRLEQPVAEAVVGVLNAAVVFLGTRFPAGYRGLMTAIDSLSER